MDLKVARAIQSQSVQAGNGFFFAQYGPTVIELDSPGDPTPASVWYVEERVPDLGYYKVSMSVKKISGDVDNVRSYVGSTQSPQFSTLGSQTSAVIYYDPSIPTLSPYPFIFLTAMIDTETLSATVEVSGFICSWS